MTLETLSLEEAALEEEESIDLADDLSGFLITRLSRFLDEYVEANNLGWVFGPETDFELPGIGKRRPDLSFCSFDTWPQLARSTIPVPPDLAVEVNSRRDESDNIDKKLNEYELAKVKLIWVVRPLKQLIEVHRIDGTASIVKLHETLKGEDVIKGFELPLSKLFALPKRPLTA